MIQRFRDWRCRHGFHFWTPLETLLWCRNCHVWEDEV